MFRLMPYKKNDVTRRENTLGDTFFDDFFNDVWFRPVVEEANITKSMKVDIQDLEDSYIVEAELPGFDKEDISINLENGLLTISAEKVEKSEDKDKKANYIRREIRSASYSRSFTVDNIKEDEISAKYENGILRLELPKLEEERPTSRSIEIK